jgi:UDP-N-acetylmuramyl pentapeptide phosphotransferase/UDP-N-acetylglucosamine-1-phosphate transferase
MGEAAAAATVALATGVLTALGTGALIPVLRRYDVVDRPNQRSSHNRPTPRGGGIAVVGSVLLAWAILARIDSAAPAIPGIALGAGGLAVVSWIDDLRGLSVGLRLLAQGAAVAIGFSDLAQAHPFAAGWLGSPGFLAAIGLLWVWWINLFNFMDGIDGIAGSEAAAIGVGLFVFATAGIGSDPALARLAAAMVGAALGFLVWNWSPARIFLGDVGSAPLGYLLGFLLLDVGLRGYWKVALILPLYFLADATITLVRRLFRGERIWRAHREHFYQKAVRAGLGHAAVVKRVVAADLALIGCAWAAENGWGPAALAASAATVAVLLVSLSRGRR